MVARIFGIALLALLFCVGPAQAQEIPYGISARNVGAFSRTEMQAFAERTLIAFEDDGSLPRREARARAQIAAGRYAEASTTIQNIRAELGAGGERWLPYELYAKARARAGARGSFERAYRQVFEEAFSAFDNLAADRTQYWFEANVDAARAGADQLLAQHAGASALSLGDAQRLLRSWIFFEVLSASSPLNQSLIAEDASRRYIIEDDRVITTPAGVTLSAVIVRPRTAQGPLPTVLSFTIYTDVTSHLRRARSAAARGYAGVVVDARGKRLSQDDIVPYEVEVDDTWAAIDWIAAQPWSNDAVGMIGGSYEGFTAWAATKRLHPALRTIAVSAAAIPGFGLPMENNVFLNANYGWAFYVANSRFLDPSQNDFARWAARNEAWYQSGRPYREIDQFDGGPNPWLQRWLDHPDYDAYWQAMVPFGEDFSRIDIPVLTITGYYDDGQISALHYTREHYRRNPDAEHYVVIGPYDHFGTHAPFKAPVLRGYAIDPVAQFSTPDLVYEWLDHVMRGGPRPTLLQDRINFEVMGANIWRHASSLATMSEESMTLYLTTAQQDGSRLLSPDRPRRPRAIEQVIDFSDRSTTGASYYPSPIVAEQPDYSRGLVFRTAPLERALEISGSFSGELGVVINKRDFDFMLALHELRADGTAMPLSYYVGRASYADDMATRRLLTPGAPTRIAFDRTRVVSRRVEAGSRLVVVLDVLRDGFHQINYGTDRDVSEESIADAREPLRIEWRTDSFIRIPVRRVQ